MTKYRKRNNRLKPNNPCPCGSGKKYKKCCLNNSTDLTSISTSIDSMRAEHHAKEETRKKQQGLGRPIISTELGDNRITAVGNKLYSSKKHKTFIDFLGAYITDILNPEWGNCELRKPLEKRNLIIQWYEVVCKYKKDKIKNPGEITSFSVTGAIRTYYGLAYNLYLLKHNVEIQEHLIQRLKDNDKCYSAYYETCVAAWFILAGFTLELENEKDHTSTHCEFTATKADRSYSVEVKTRQPKKECLDIGNQLYNALKKTANHPRIVFIDLNVDINITEEQFSAEIPSKIKGREKKLTIEGKPAPQAYLIVTNMPYHLNLDLDLTEIPSMILGESFKISDFGHTAEFTSLIEMYKASKKYTDIKDIMKTASEYSIPSTFNGELPEFAFGQAERRFKIGEKYELDDGSIGTLHNGVVLEEERNAYMVFLLENDQNSIYTVKLSEAEISAYKQHPETFFGTFKKVGSKINTPLAMFEFFYECYKNTPREKILEFFSQSPDIRELSKLQDDELRLKYAERCTLAAIAEQKKAENNSNQTSSLDSSTNPLV